MIGNASVVAVSEGTHFAAEPLQFRNRVFQYLVEKQGFTAIAIESGIVEGRVVHDYVRGGPGDVSTVLKQGISWTFDRLPENRALVQWLREYNADPRHARKINFYGFDVPGSPGNPHATRHMETALVETLQYLAGVDSTAAAAFHARVDSLLPKIRLDFPDYHYRPPDAPPGYETLSGVERDALTATIADLVTLLERRQAPYEAASTVNDYQWAYRAAIGARQLDSWVRQTPLGWEPSNKQTGFFSVATDVRDRAQADNLDWIVKQEGPSGKVLVFAHRGHLSSVPVSGREVAGTYLRRRFDSRLVTIGNLIGKGEVGCPGFEETLKPAPPDTIDGLAGQLGTPRFLMDLRAAPTPVANWLDQERELGPGFRVVVGKAFDILFYLDVVSPACPQGAG
jgi:erythromycin esterase